MTRFKTSFESFDNCHVPGCEITQSDRITNSLIHENCKLRATLPAANDTFSFYTVRRICYTRATLTCITYITCHVIYNTCYILHRYYIIQYILGYRDFYTYKYLVAVQCRLKVLHQTWIKIVIKKMCTNFILALLFYALIGILCFEIKKNE